MQAIRLDEYKALFVLVPKTATSSIRAQLWPGRTKWTYEKDCRASEWPGWFRFAFVRNPWDRLVSCWQSKIHKYQTGLIFHAFRRYKWTRLTCFAKFIDDVCNMDPKARDHHFSEQYPQLLCGGEWCVDFLGKFETLEADWLTLNEHFPTSPLPKRGVSKHTDYKTYYNRRLRAQVEKAYERDIGTFGYTFGGRDNEPVQSGVCDVLPPVTDSA